MRRRREFVPLLFLVAILAVYQLGAAVFEMNGRIAFLFLLVLGWIAVSIWYSRIPDRNFSLLAHGSAATRHDERSSLTIGKAILIGELFVNLPALALMAVTITACVVAWFWWAATAPRWRLWAIERVSDPLALKAAAIGAQLIWPEHDRRRVFSRTEITSARHAERERQIIEAFLARRASEQGGS